MHHPSLEFLVRRSAVMAVGLFSTAAVTRALASAPSWLVTPEEVVRDRALAPPSETQDVRSFSNAKITNTPTIQLLQPEQHLRERLKSPLSIEVRFLALPDSEVDPATFRVIYGMIGLDITNRILAAAPLTPEGLIIKEAFIPAGRHLMRLQISDKKKRTGDLELRVQVI